MNDIQIGDTVELLEDSVCFHHQIGNRLFKKGDRVVVVNVGHTGIFYQDDSMCWISKQYIKKVTPNQVEVKFR
jgi:hypothetical protein